MQPPLPLQLDVAKLAGTAGAILGGPNWPAQEGEVNRRPRRNQYHTRDPRDPMYTSFWTFSEVIFQVWCCFECFGSFFEVHFHPRLVGKFQNLGGPFSEMYCLVADFWPVKFSSKCHFWSLPPPHFWSNKGHFCSIHLARRFFFQILNNTVLHSIIFFPFLAHFGP
jgi:hypothetical protein